jgi:hypothetical protein
MSAFGGKADMKRPTAPSANRVVRRIGHSCCGRHGALAFIAADYASCHGSNGRFNGCAKTPPAEVQFAGGGKGTTNHEGFVERPSQGNLY